MENVSREALVVQAIEAFLVTREKDRFSLAFGLWGPDGKDGLELEQETRREWQYRD